MLSTFFTLVMVGGLFVFADSYITMGLLGFENPYLIIGLSVMWIMALVGFKTSDDKPQIILALVGLPIGVVLTNYLRVSFFDASSVLQGIGL